MSRHLATIALAAGAMFLATAHAGAGSSSNRGSDSTFKPRNWQSVFVQRYPGDQALAGGTVRTQGPQKGPYVERCYWTAKPGFLGIPFNLTQHCYRHTLDNTPQ
jgi:hypothetical protein